jgi:DNA polymerase-3 subunit epsilon
MEILVIDIETTDFLKSGGKIVEVGIVELNLLNGQKKILYDKVTHERGITRDEVENAWIISNSDLTVEDVRTSKRLDLLLPEIQNILDRYPLGATAFNRSFDFDFLENRGIHFPKKLPCPMLLSTDVCKLPGMRGKFKWPKVEEAYNHFFPNNSYVEKHRGADDAFHEADIVYKLYRKGLFKVDAL